MALITSFLFLLMYVVYHITTPETKFCRRIYKNIIFFILITHVVLAAISFPFILFTYIKVLLRCLINIRGWPMGFPDLAICLLEWTFMLYSSISMLSINEILQFLIDFLDRANFVKF
ncbi:MAG: DUF420 domain-containing protein [Saprospiraceae bacterium]|nr:DUF420 domain-containing protein [Saprospiraceae bacterium]